MQYALSVHQRLLLLGILPEEGNLTTIRIVRELREALSFSESEHEALKLRVEGGRVFWEDDVVGDKDIDIGPKAAEVVRDALGNLDADGKLTVEHLTLCELFEYGAD